VQRDGEGEGDPREAEVPIKGRPERGMKHGGVPPDGVVYSGGTEGQGLVGGSWRSGYTKGLHFDPPRRSGG
jgi:hypothetical protein